MMQRQPSMRMTAAIAIAHAIAAGASAESPALASARKALAENIPQVAIVKLNAALAEKDIPASERAAAQRLLAESQLAAGLPDDARNTLAGFTDASDIPATLLRGHAYAATGRWADALPVYQSLNGHPAASPQAALGEAESLQSLGRTAEAVTVLERLLASGCSSPRARLRLASLLVELGRGEDARRIIRETDTASPADANWRRYVEARTHLLEKNTAAALAILEPMLATPDGRHPPGLSENLIAAATLALAEAHAAPGNPRPAQKIIEAFIRANPESPQIELAFRRLDQFYAAEKNPSEGALHSFFRELPPRAAALAKFYVTRMQVREKDYAKAATSAGQFLAKYPDHTLVPGIHSMKAELAILTSTPATAREALAAAESALDAAALAAKSGDAKAEFALRTALVNLQQGEFLRAATHLKTAREHPRHRQSAMFNSALAWLMQKNHALFATELAAFASEFSAPLLVGQLRLEQGLVKARSGSEDAPQVLREFLKEFPSHPRRSEAQLAYAELGFAAGKPEEAEAFVHAAATDKDASAETVDRADYLAIFLEDSKQPRDVAQVVKLAREFITRHPASPHLAEVRMKLGQVFFNTDDFLKAQEQFETLAEAQPGSPFTETAFYLAGQCAMKLINTNALNHALGLFDKVAERKGPLEAHARLQQAVIKNKLGEGLDAVKIYDAILSATAPIAPEVRYAALIGRGDNLVSLAQATDPPPDPKIREKHLTDAIASYDTLLALPEPPPEWRNQAAYKRAKSLLQLSRPDDALAALYDVLERNTSGPRETFWYSKAGFEAAGILEARKQWRNAIGVCEKMAKVPGPHAAQARERVKTLRLEHFIWD